MTAYIIGAIAGVVLHILIVIIANVICWLVGKLRKYKE